MSTNTKHSYLFSKVYLYYLYNLVFGVQFREFGLFLLCRDFHNKSIRSYSITFRIMKSSCTCSHFLTSKLNGTFKWIKIIYFYSSSSNRLCKSFIIGHLMEASKKEIFFGCPATKARSFFGGNFFRASKKVIFSH